ncbi:MAG TPA: vanadium-dependent haloperoxidase, partial [Chthoniobacterales bacterium]|nr:vanadium-dependent haloperoxidase [Chthoniobacterales bacterium]
MKLNTHFGRGLTILAALLPLLSTLRADVVTDWNAIAVQATLTGSRPGPTGVFDVATVQVAVYDAIQAIEKRYEPYYVDVPGAAGSSTVAAAKAAHDVLVHRFPAQSSALDNAYQQYLSNHGLSENDPGAAVGAAAAAGIIALRAADGSFPASAPAPFTGGLSPGVWRPTPPANLAMFAPWMAHVVPFSLTRPSQFSCPSPPALTSTEYARDYDEVKALGAQNSTARTADQTDMAYFHAGNVVVMWNQALRDIAAARVQHIADSSRLFALANMATADCLIAAWNDKKRYAFWRPITAIREGATDDNAATAPDAEWQPLLTTPNYPDYPSGAANFASAATRVIEHFFETDYIPFSITTTNTGPTAQDTRSYARLSDAAQEVVDARIYSGIHFRFADEAARAQGRQVADWIFGTRMRPLGSRSAVTTVHLVNISARGLVQTGDDVLITGFIVEGASEKNVIVRALGPSLPLARNLPDPSLELFDRNGTALAVNDNWRDAEQAAIIATGLAPNDERESAVV